MLALLLVFAIIHSGGAALRVKAESFIGPRLWRLIFASLSIPLAVLLISYFLAHRYDGIRLWNLQGVPGMVPFIWCISAISFLFLYPATYNLLEIPALAKPQVKLYETGIIRVSRHPQAIGQILWCLAHGLWIGSSFMLVTSAGLIGHHLFAVWHGDRRLRAKFGEDFEKIKKNTSVIPFIAVLDGRQKLQLKEFIRPSQLGILLAVATFWWSHRFITLGTELFLSSKFSELFP
ncbi:Conserved NnrU/NnuR-like membrane enzyme [Prochlorococcus marinus str. SS51]|nr:Conserved NnrU/NnuR-like membrane enzyme [Prochlorococcus marinus str. LG]KGG32681.1 Conserved NnrU/NnuR-like membrane enzyme [Prochlorococcus marinus str. SS51]